MRLYTNSPLQTTLAGGDPDGWATALAEPPKKLNGRRAVAPHDLFVGLAAQERLVLQLLLPNRRFAAPIVAAAGLTVHHFGQDDHKLIFAGWEVACEHDLSPIDMLRLIRRALQADGLWDGRTPAGSTGMRHSDMTLARLGTHRMTAEEMDYAVGRGPRTDPLARSIAQNVVALVTAAGSLARGAA